MYPIELSSLRTPLLFGRARQDRGWNHTGRVISSHLWVFMMAGCAEFQLGEVSVVAKRGDAVFIPAGTFYAPKTPEMADYYFFHLEATACGLQSGNESPAPLPPTAPYFTLAPERHEGVLSLPLHMPRGAHSAEIEAALSRCERLTSEQGSEARLLFALEAHRALVLAARGTARALPRALADMCSYLGDRASEEVSLSSLAAHFGYSSSYVARLFRVHLGTTVSAYRNDLRLAGAYRLLLDTDLRVREIAEICGFSDIYYFSRLVRRRFGMSPMGLRASRSFPVCGV